MLWSLHLLFNTCCTLIKPELVPQGSYYQGPHRANALPTWRCQCHMDKTSQALKYAIHNTFINLHYSYRQSDCNSTTTKQHEVKECARHTLQHEDLLKGTNNLTGSHKQSFIVFIPHLWPTILTYDTVKILRFYSSENVIVFTLQNLYFETYVMVRIVFSYVQNKSRPNLTLSAPPRPYIHKGRSDYHACYKKYLTQHSKTETLNTVIQCLEKYFNL